MAEAKEDSPSSPSGGESKLDARKDVLQQVMNFAMSDDFEAAFEDFAELHKGSFLKVLVMEDGAEHPLEWHGIYLDYLHTFEGKIERFINRTGFDINDFYEECKLILEGENVWGETRFFLEALLATSEYENFVQLMRNEMERFRPQLEIEEGAADDDDEPVPGSPSRQPSGWSDGTAGTPGSGKKDGIAGGGGGGGGSPSGAGAEPFQSRISPAVSREASPKHSLSSSPGPGPGAAHGPHDFQRLDSKGNAVGDDEDQRLDSKGEPQEGKESK